jgi:flagellar basal body rod protein FlgB
MGEFSIFDPSFDNITRAIDVSTKIQATVAQNIANSNTPGYEAMKFDTELGKAVKRSDKKEVVLEEEIALMTENNIKHSAYIKFLSAKLNILRSIVTQGRK